MTRRSMPALFLMSVLAGGCDLGVTNDIEIWEGSLSAVDASLPVRGTAVAISRGRTTEASIQIINAAPSTEYRWEFATGTCSQPGDRVGGAASYPRLETGASGAATSSSVLSEPMPGGDSYVATVSRSDESGVIIACGEFQSR